MADRNLVLSMLSHAIYAIVCVPLVGILIASIALDGEKYTASICFYTILFGLWLFRDLVIFTRTQPTSYWLQEFFMTGGLLGFFILQIQQTYVGNDTKNYPHVYTPDVLYSPWLALAIVVTFLPVVSFLIFSVSAFMRWRRERPMQSTDRGGVKSFLIGSRRSPEGRAEFFNSFCYCASRHSVFRKHSFEPASLAIVRGCIALCCCGGLLVFGIYSIAVAQQKGGIVTESLLTIPSRGQGDYYNLVTIYAETSLGVIAPSLSISDCSNQTVVRTTVDGTQVWSCSITFPLSFPTIRITSSENSTINLWILINTSQSNQSISEGSFYKEKQYTTPLILPPNTSIAVYYTVAQIIYGKTVWFKLIPETTLEDFDDAVPFNSSMTLHWNNGQIYVQQEVETGLKAALQAIGTVGGIFSFADGIFALIFGRTMLALLTGGRPISPFGMLGLVARRKFRKAIREQFPDLLKESEQHGLAAFVKEVALNIDFVMDPNEIPMSPDTAISTGEKFPQSPMV